MSIVADSDNILGVFGTLHCCIKGVFVQSLDDWTFAFEGARINIQYVQTVYIDLRSNRCTESVKKWPI